VMFFVGGELCHSSTRSKSIKSSSVDLKEPIHIVQVYVHR